MSFQTFGNQRCVEPRSVLESCERLGLPTSWFGAPEGPNGFATSLGVRSGRGLVLLPGSSLTPSFLAAQHDLALGLAPEEVKGGASGRFAVLHRNLHVVLARCVTPGLRGDADACYLVELADRRRLLRPRPVNKAYNVRSTPGSAAYFSATKDGGSAWTWQAMVSDLGAAAGITETLALPFTPDGTPEGFDFCGRYAMDALGVVLDRVGCALSLDTHADTFGVVRVGAADAAASAALARSDRYRVLDSYFLDSPLGRYPASVRVFFPKSRTNPDATGASPFYTADATDPSGTPAGVSAGTCAILYDDLPATYDSTDALGNSAALAARAAERAADFYRRLRLDRLSRLYGLPLDAPGLRPGSQVMAVRHADRGRGLVTQVASWPGAPAGAPFAGMVGTGAEPPGGAGGGGPACCDDPLVNGGGGGYSASSVWAQADVYDDYGTWVLGPARLLTYLLPYLTAMTLPCCSGLTITAAAGGTTALDASSTSDQLFTGSATQTVLLPAVSTIPLGKPYVIDNRSTGAVTVQSSGGNTVATVLPGGTATFTSVLTAGTTASSWDAYQSGTTAAGKIVTADGNGNLTTANALVPAYATTATAAGTTTLTVASPQTQRFTGTTTQTLVLPVTGTLVPGFPYTVLNDSTGSVTVQSSGGNTVTTLAAGTSGVFTAVDTGVTTAAAWESQVTAPAAAASPGSFAQTATATVTGTTGETALTNSGQGSLTLAANFFAAGGTIAVSWGGSALTIAPGHNVVVRLKLGTVVLSWTLAPGGGSFSGAWQGEARFTARAAGAVSAFAGVGMTFTGVSNSPGTAADSVGNLDTTGTLAVALTAQLSNGGDSIDCTNLVVWRAY